MSHSQRLHTIQSTLEDKTALVISDPLDIFYLTGFTCLTPEEREALVLLTKDSATLFLTAFSAPVKIEGLIAHVGGIERLLREHAPQICQKYQISTLQIDGNSLRFAEYELIKSMLPAGIVIQPTTEPPLQHQRMVKDADEIDLITHANHITHRALQFTINHLEIGMTELEVQEIFEDQVRKMGTKQFAFPTIVAFGPHSALPHHQPGNQQLTTNQSVLIDCGAKWQGYCADVTRTIWFGDSPDPEFVKIESIVKEAYSLTTAGLQVSPLSRKASDGQSMSAGITSPTREKTPSEAWQMRDVKNDSTHLTASSLDTVCRDYITQQGYGPQFIHTTGHGVGLYIHEQPSLNPRNTTPLAEYMVITVEPGIYLPEKFGYRFENSLLVTSEGYRELL